MQSYNYKSAIQSKSLFLLPETSETKENLLALQPHNYFRKFNIPTTYAQQKSHKTHTFVGNEKISQRAQSICCRRRKTRKGLADICRGM